MDTKVEPDRSEAVEVVKEYEDMFRRLADSDLPIAEDARRALQLLDDEYGKHR